MANFDLSNLALNSTLPANELLYDDKGMPSVMVYIPKFKISDVIEGGGDSTHSAFIVNGVEVSGVYISKFQNIVQDGRAYSLPGRDPKTNIHFDTAKRYCEAKGKGWHLMTRAEWALIALWCKNNGFLPYGNNNYGKDSRESVVKAIPTTVSVEGKTGRVATGTGPLTWSHDSTMSGIWDLNGNINEWVGGLRTVYGEVQVLSDNNAADSDRSQEVSSTDWRAIDATTGDYIIPDGSGTTEKSIKINIISNRVTYCTTITNQSAVSKNCLFGNATCDTTISDAAKTKLYALALLPNDTTATNYEGDYFFYNNGGAEYLTRCGGDCGFGTNSGLFCIYACSVRSYTDSVIGFRSAFVKL